MVSVAETKFSPSPAALIQSNDPQKRPADPVHQVNWHKQVCTRGFCTVCRSSPPPSVSRTSRSNTGRHEELTLQIQKTVQSVSVRVIVLAFALLAALLLASAAGYLIRGGIPSTSSAVDAPATIHFQQMTDNQMERAQVRAQASPELTSPYGVGH